MRNPVSASLRYKDADIRILVILVGFHVITEYGGNTPWLSRILSKDYYIEFGSSLVITALVIQMIYLATRIMYRFIDWHQHFLDDRPIS